MILDLEKFSNCLLAVNKTNIFQQPALKETDQFSWL